MHPDDREASKHRLQNIKLGHHGYDCVPVRYVGERGRLIDAEVGSMPFVFHGESVILTIIHDVTERNLRLLADAKLQKRMEQGQRLESMGVMAGGIAHDFNNLLAVILGHADMVIYDLKRNPAAVEKSLECIVQASESAALLCQQMLAYSGKGKFVVEPISLSKTIHDMQGLLDVAIGKDTQVMYQVDDVSMVQGDASQLQQVVMNLLTNAAEAITHPFGEIKLHVFELGVDTEYLARCHHNQAALGRYVCLEVSDNGCGMSNEVIDKIFEPFYSTKFTGRGLGMSAILGITLGHQGMIAIESTLEQGTAIRVLLPCYDVSGVNKDKLSVKTDGVEYKLSATVLLVDDESQVLVMARKMLEGFGLDVITAHNGKEAVEIYTQNMAGIDLVMLDLTMPEMNGNDTYAALLSLNTKVKVLICSGYTEEAVKSDFCQLKELTFIAKPYHRSAVWSAISKLLV
ncbi:MAG: response regulator [Ghiorsea sp.]|nr:response regulator [Ghiorsea sp.]